MVYLYVCDLQLPLNTLLPKAGGFAGIIVVGNMDAALAWINRAPEPEPSPWESAMKSGIQA
jgi:hypothetical protein